jgi:protein TonB
VKQHSLSSFKNNVQYPAYERDNDIQGRVIVGFVVYEDGSIHDVVVKRGVSEGLNNEAVRVIKMMPNFKPGKQQGKPFVLPMCYLLFSN